jgi:hypothetical protein
MFVDVVPDPGDARPAVRVGAAWEAPLQLAASTGSLEPTNSRLTAASTPMAMARVVPTLR